MIKLAIVSPCYNEEEVLEQSAARLTALFDELVGKEKISADSFVLFVNDGSKDRTWNIIKKLHKENPYVKGMNLARNVGHQSAIMAGMMTAKDWSDAVVTIDADLQDDLNAIEEMIDAYTAVTMWCTEEGLPPGRPVVETSFRYGFLQTATQDGSGIHL